MRADMPFITIFQLLGRCPFEPGEVVTIVKSQELVQVLASPGGPSAGCPWHKSGRRGGPMQEPAGVCRTTETHLYLGVRAKGYDFRLKGMTISKDN